MIQTFRNKLKFALLDRWRIPHSQISGVPHCLFQRYRNSGPISVIDIGAYKGHFTIGLDQLCKVKRAVLIEPNERLVRAMRTDPSLSNFRIVDNAVSDFDGEIDMKIFPNAPDMSSALALDGSSAELTERTHGEAEIVRRPVRKLDTLLAGGQNDAIDIIKIDVQGLEHLVIAGATETLKRSTAVYVEVSFRPLYEGSSVFHEIHSMMMKRGFIMSALELGYWSNAGELLQCDVLFLNPSIRIWNA